MQQQGCKESNNYGCGVGASMQHWASSTWQRVRACIDVVSLLRRSRNPWLASGVKNGLRPARTITSKVLSFSTAVEIQIGSKVVDEAYSYCRFVIERAQLCCRAQELSCKFLNCKLLKSGASLQSTADPQRSQQHAAPCTGSLCRNT